MITETEFNSIRPDDQIKINDTIYTVEEVDVNYRKYQITKLYYGNNPKIYTRDAPYEYNNIKDIIKRIIKAKISCWRKVIENGK